MATIFSRFGLVFKITTLVLLSLFLLVPILAINGIISERQSRRYEARTEIAKTVGGTEQLWSPVLVVPYTYKVTRRDIATAKDVVDELSGVRWITPETISFDVNLRTEERYRGIHKIPIYHADIRVRGIFPGVDYTTFGIPENAILGPAKFIVSVSDLNAIEKVDNVYFMTETFPLDRYRVDNPSVAAWSTNVTIAANVSIPDETHGSDFQFELTVSGTESIYFAPSGRKTTVTVDSNWPHPSFIGDQLATEREIRPDGFRAIWERSGVNADIQGALRECTTIDCTSLLHQAPTYGVALVDPIDIYSLSNRSVKYGWLFIVLTFVACFLIEVLKRISVHPIQYGLVGSALAMFFLLLLALSEHIRFDLAYVIASLACVGLITIYLIRVLQNRLLGFSLGVKMAVLYGVLFVILQSEDYALLMGAILVFGILAIVMLLTRNVNWYAIGDRSQEKQPV